MRVVTYGWFFKVFTCCLIANPERLGEQKNGTIDWFLLAVSLITIIFKKHSNFAEHAHNPPPPLALPCTREPSL